MEFQLLEVTGRDAKDFLHRLTTVNLKKLTPGLASLGLLLKGNSKVVGQFVLAETAPMTFALIGEREVMGRVLIELESLHFSEDLEMKLSDSPVTVVPDRLEAAPFAWDGDVKKGRVPTGIPGFAFCVGMSVPVSDRFEFARIEAGVPWAGKEWDSTTNALDAGLEPWIARQKGCYPGQEVVERSLNVGHPAKALVKLEADASIPEGAELHVAGKAVGRITSSVGNIALAIVQWNFRNEPEFQWEKGVARCRK